MKRDGTFRGFSFLVNLLGLEVLGLSVANSKRFLVLAVDTCVEPRASRGDAY